MFIIFKHLKGDTFFMKLTLPDGSVKEFKDGMTPLEIATELAPSLGKKIICAKVDDNLYDKSKPLSKDCHFKIITEKDAEAFEVLNHSCAHLMAQALSHLYPGIQFGYGPALPEGFYYDVKSPKPITEKDFPAIEAEMHKIAKEALPIVRREISPEEAEVIFKDQKFKTIHIDEVEDRDHCVSIYSQGDFTDLCRGPHMPNTSFLKNFKLLSLAGCYWKGDKNNEQLTRIYGCCFFSSKELEDYIKIRKERAESDHRKIGKEMGLFLLSEYGPGMPFWLNNGWAMKRALEDWLLKILRKHNYQMVQTPQVLSRKLWEISGHWDHYKENMFTTSIEGQDYAVKPMNCPGAIQVYNNSVHSYRDLPVRIGEYGLDHRAEASGSLNGLLRVRCFTQDDSHIFLTLDQLEDEVNDLLSIYKEVYTTFGLPYSIELSTMPDDQIGTVEQWQTAEAQLRKVMDDNHIPYDVNPGDGAFYGPKLDFKVLDSMRRQWQCGTIQLDMQLPGRFGCYYVDKNGNHQTPVMIHRAVLGTFDRFIGVITEHFKGNFPTWFAPVQVELLPVFGQDQAQVDLANKLRNKMIDLGYRSEIDARDESIGYRIRETQTKKIPYSVVIGKNEVANNQVTYRVRGSSLTKTVSIDEFFDILRNDCENHLIKPLPIEENK